MIDRELLLVRNAAEAAVAATRLAGAREVGVDVEMSGLHSFRAEVCVLQLAGDALDVIVDTVALESLGPLEAVLAQAGPVRFAHGAAHDVKCLKADFGVQLSGLFDTYVAAQLLDLPKHRFQ